MPDCQDRDWLTVKETADWLGVVIETVRRRISRGEIEAQKIEGEWRIDPNSIQTDEKTLTRQDGPEVDYVRTEAEGIIQTLREQNEELKAELAKKDSDIEHLREMIDRQDKEVQWLRESVRRQESLVNTLAQKVPQLPAPGQTVMSRMKGWLKKGSALGEEG